MNTKEGMDRLIASNNKLIKSKVRYDQVIEAMMTQGLDCSMALETVKQMEDTIAVNKETIKYIGDTIDRQV